MNRWLMSAILLAGGASALAQDAKLGDIRIEAAFARATPGGVKDGAAYMTLHNSGKQADRLVAVTTAAAGKAELHNHVMEGGVAKMREVPGIDLPAGGKTELKPGGYHVMLVGLKAPLKDGESLALELRFERSGAVSMKIPVKASGAMGHKGH